MVRELNPFSLSHQRELNSQPSADFLGKGQSKPLSADTISELLWFLGQSPKKFGRCSTDFSNAIAFPRFFFEPRGLSFS